ncbi:transketolase [Akkermansiaceae bacterium]|nr:transketolase [Akkermansiaceae bacterium]
MKRFEYEIRKKCLDVALKVGSNGSHLGGGLSTVEIFASLYGDILNFDCKKPFDQHRDRLVVSKGHCVLAYYSVLFLKGFLTKEQLDSFEVNGSHFHGHATRNLKNGIEFSGGSLGLGISFAVGQALALKSNNNSAKVYVIIGDGECNEGIVWEAMMSASHFKLDNLIVIIDDNKLQYDGNAKDVLDLISMEHKFNAFGAEVANVDGHNRGSITSALKNFHEETKPKVLIADTIKGKGVKFMEGVKEWHHSALSLEQYELAMSQIRAYHEIE